MSRLIDADALQAEYKEYHGGKRLLLIDTAPTIEPRKRGRWEEKGIAFIRDTNIEKVQEMRCSKCKRWLITPYSRYYLTHHKFCPNCGADMREEEQDEDDNCPA